MKESHHGLFLRDGVIVLHLCITKIFIGIDGAIFSANDQKVIVGFIDYFFDESPCVIVRGREKLHPRGKGVTLQKRCSDGLSVFL